MLVVGLTGGIAAGKSLVSQYLRELGAQIIDADLVARELVSPHSSAMQEIVRHFGSEIVNEDGSLKRKELGQLIFRFPAQRKVLNEIMHPHIIARIADAINEYRALGRAPLIVVDAPLLIETGLHQLVDEVWLVDIPEELQILRLRERDGLTEEAARQRLQSQLPLAEKRKYAYRIIDNSGEMLETKELIHRIWQQVVK